MAKEKELKLTNQNQRKKRRIFYVLLLVLMFFLLWGIISLVNHGKMAPEEGSSEKAVATKNLDGELVVATTTSLQDSGLLDVLVPAFEKESGLKVKIIAVGTGEALEMGRRQVADVLLVHAPDLEAKFIQEGFGLRREEFMLSEMVIAGPAADEAAIRGKSFVEAFSRIASVKRPFVSRADKSGTHHLEMKIWEVAGISPSGDWYLQTGQGMGESLLLASERQAYILTDYPTFRQLSSQLKLEVLTNDAKYKNIYSGLTIKNLSGKINTTGAEALVDFLISEKAQKIISEFGRKRPEDKPIFIALRLNQAKDKGE
ncbi:MAG TPA: tungsten ABC transporter substrate-binding protein [Candidatus Aminicenantes bacterium]|nr:MAG: tungsten ABC transporter substrate-binding protein [Candidatus Aminicenantes bacterium]HEK84878.1 tungsten ABC transporter substrate-binding protein [Candidatus Aminicenantes bacterium]